MKLSVRADWKMSGPGSEMGKGVVVSGSCQHLPRTINHILSLNYVGSYWLKSPWNNFLLHEIVKSFEDKC